MYSVDLYMTHTHGQARKQPRTHTHMRHAFTHTHTRACMHERAHTRTHTHAQTLTCAYANARVHACAHARAYAHASAHTHTNTHTAHKTHKHACMDLCAHTHAHAHTRIHLQMSRVHVVDCVFYICRSSIQSHDASCEIWSPVSAKKTPASYSLFFLSSAPAPPMFNVAVGLNACCLQNRAFISQPPNPPQHAATLNIGGDGGYRSSVSRSSGGRLFRRYRNRYRMGLVSGGAINHNFIFVYLHLYAQTLSSNTYTYTYTYTYTHTYIHILLHVYIYMCVYVYVCAYGTYMVCTSIGIHRNTYKPYKTL